MKTVTNAMQPTVKWAPLAVLAIALGAFPAAADEDSDVRSIVGEMDQALRNSEGRERAEVETAITDLNQSLMSAALDEDPGGFDEDPAEVEAAEIDDLEAAGGDSAYGVGASTLDSDSAQGVDGAAPGDWEPFDAADGLNETVFYITTEGDAGDSGGVVESEFIDDEFSDDEDDEGDSGSTPDSG